jgi:hypothetical protein
VSVALFRSGAGLNYGHCALLVFVRERQGSAKRLESSTVKNPHVF